MFSFQEKDKETETEDKRLNEESADSVKKQESYKEIITRLKKLYSDIVKGYKEASTWTKEEMKRYRGGKNSSEKTKTQKLQENNTVCKNMIIFLCIF